MEVETGTQPSVENHVEIQAGDCCYDSDEYDTKSAIFTPQSGPEGTTVSVGAEMSSTQNILFRDQNPSYTYAVDYVDDPTRAMQDTDDATLDNFFSRPLKISEEGWGTGTVLGYDFNPWQLYFNNPRVINRLTNYNLMRAKLHLKIMINGNGFQYGRAIVAYLPQDEEDQMSSLSALIPQDIVQTSQLPHVYVDPTTSTGGEMCLPLFYQKNSLEIPTAQYSNLGRIFVRSINALKHANGALDQCTVSIFAWAEDVQLNVLTSTDASTLVAQSGKEKSSKKKPKQKTMRKTDKGGRKSNYAKQEGGKAAGKEVAEANTSGMVSGPATTIMKVANALSFIPQIAPFAIATSKVAGGVANIAKSLGYSRPPMTKNPDPYRPTPISQLATTTTPDTALKMTVDDLQELTIDPSIAGLGPEDPLCIQNIASRESYLTKFTWAMGTAPESLLYNLRVDPVQWDMSGGVAYHFPATAMAALPFEYWTGTLKFRFQIVCSAFHKGRLKFVYDPQSLASNEYNTNYIEVIDIAETQDFTLEIGNGQDVSLLRHAKPGIDVVADQHNTTLLGSKSFANGILGIYVVNELTTPNSTVNNNIEINVFISAGDDFEVFVPDCHFQKFVFKQQTGPGALGGQFEDALEAQSGKELVPEAQNTQEPSAPEHSSADRLGPGDQETAYLNKVFTGEAIMSFRPLLKRYNLWRREKIHTGVGTVRQRIQKTRSIFPFYRGNVQGAVDTSANGPYNYCNTVLLHWVCAAHSGWRGSIRYKLLFDRNTSGSSAHASSRVYVERGEIKPFGQFSYTNSYIPYDNNDTNADAARQVILGESIVTGACGMVYATDLINNAVEFEVPYYSQYRFTPGKIINYTSSTRFNWSPTYNIDMISYAAGRDVYDYHVAAGEDFQVYFFTGLPRMYYEDLPPPTV